MAVTRSRKPVVLATIILILIVPAVSQIYIETDLTSPVLYSDENRTYDMLVRSDTNVSSITVEVTGGLSDILTVEQIGETATGQNYVVQIDAPEVEQEQTFSGTIVAYGGQDSEQFPLNVRVLPLNNSRLDMTVGFVDNEINLGSNASVYTRIQNVGTINTFDFNVSYEFKRSNTGETLFRTNKRFKFNDSASTIIELPLSRLDNVTRGSYYVQAWVVYNDRVQTSIDNIRIVQPFWTPTRFRVAGFVIIGLLVTIAGIKLRGWYLEKRKEEARYVFPVDYDKLPADEGTYWVGKVAETSKSAHVDPADLTTHAIVAGSTGAGKSVTASVIIEEALEQGVPAVVFDPTAQWTGFVKECMDDNLLDHYDRFDMDPEDDPHPYKGLIKKVDADDIDIDFEDLMNEGEVTVFTLDHLSTEEFDAVVREIIDAIFDVEWEESSELEMIVVFDEVHRLLEEYGGQGGYQALERGAREFRKWGIGLVMASQVTADFKQAVSGNIMTEVQMQTKSMEDIGRIETKYGSEFAKRISSEEVGTGMIQHPEYNDGDPWFVDFRPTYHNPHKIPDEELEKYHEYTAKADRLQAVIDEKEEAGEDMYDERLELKLAKDKLKEGRFKMAEIYLDSLADSLDVDED